MYQMRSRLLEWKGEEGRIRRWAIPHYAQCTYAPLILLEAVRVQAGIDFEYRIEWDAAEGAALPADALHERLRVS